MALRTIPFLFLWALTAANASVSPTQAQPPIQEPAALAGQDDDRPLLREAFQAQLTKDQLAELKGQPTTLEQLIKQMSPEQREGARGRLGELERSATTPEELKEIAKGYLMLDEKETADPGERAVRVATRLQQMEPEKSDGFTLAASGYHQMGDYPAATDWAREALKRDPADETAKAVFVLSVGRVRRSGAGMAGVPTSGAGEAQDGGFAAPPVWSIPETGVSPQALGLMQQAVAARRAGDMEKTLQLAQAAMQSDPTSAGVQKFYQLVDADHAKHADTTEFLRLSKEALDAGRGAEAVAWAQKAAERSRHPTVYKILELTKQQGEKMAQAAVKGDSASKDAPAGGGLPLWPLGVGLGLAAIGYGVSRSRATWAEQDAEAPEDEDSNSERLQRNRHNLKVAAVSAAIGFGIVYGWPWLAGTAAPAGAKFARDAGGSFQRVLASETGAIGSIEQRTAGGIPQSVAQGARLKEHLRQLQIYGNAGFKELQNGRIRYYGTIDRAQKAGEMLGRRRVREWDPLSGTYRTWMETVDQAGQVRIVHPKPVVGELPHYMFEKNGNYDGKF